LYTLTIFLECRTELWRKISFAIFIICVNALHDELTNMGAIFDYSEYIASILVIVFIFIPKKTKTKL
jgi:hypothetical protein